MTGERDFLSRLDDAVEGRCACGCARPITDRSPSAYYATEICHDRWHQRTSPKRPAAPPLSLDWPSEIAEWARAFEQQARTAQPAFTLAMARYVTAVEFQFKPLAESLRKAATALLRADLL